MASELGFSRPEGIDVALGLVAIANIGVAWLTWVKVGASTRNSYEVFRSAQRFNLEALDPVRFAWFLLPVFTLGCLLLLVIGLRLWAGVIALIQSIFVGLVSLVVIVIGVDIGLGPVFGLISGIGGIPVAAGAFMSLKTRSPI